MTRETGAPFGFLGRCQGLLKPAQFQRAARALGLAAVALLAAACGQSPTAPTSAPAAVELITYTGVVFEPYVFHPDGAATGRTASGVGAAITTPIPGARVTIVGGQPHGRTAVTDAEGRFAFEDYPQCLLESAECLSRRFRVEKAGYETRELGASDPFWPDGRANPPEYSPIRKRIPMGHAWPDDPKIQRMRRDLPAVRPLFLFENPYLRGAAGTFSGGGVFGGLITLPNLDWSPYKLHTVAHEYCHAHQKWVLEPDPVGLSDGANWQYTPEGRAFVAALEADRRTNHPFLDYVEIRSYRGNNRRNIYEEFAEVCAHWFYEGQPKWSYYRELLGHVPVGREYFRVHLPHLHAFSEEWLRWRRWERRR